MSRGGSGQRQTILPWTNLEDTKLEHAERLTRITATIGALNEASKTIIAINGGAAIAMGALYQALIAHASLRPIREALVWGITITTLGVFLAAVSLLLRYVALNSPDPRPVYGNTWGLWALATGIVSLACFVVGMGVPLIAAMIYR